MKSFLIIPMGGTGSRFVKAGYETYKPFLPAEGKFTILDNIIKNFRDLNNQKNLKELNTGDIGFFDKDKYFFIRSRSKRISKIYGIRLDLEELEKKLLNYGIKIISVSNDKKVGIFYNPSQKMSLKKIKQKVEEITNQNSDIFLFTKLKNIPRTTNQKIDYNKLKKLL